MAEALYTEPTAYQTFNDFFTRLLKTDARPIAAADFICPVDGAISQYGAILHDHIFQAKGHRFSTTDLLGDDQKLGALFENGSFANLYLSPKDYHRIHMPCDGQLMQMTYIRGKFFSVNPLTARHIPHLFARNERVVCLFDSLNGPFALVLVGATIVGSMATAWHGVVNAPRSLGVHTWHYKEAGIHLKKGEEMGRFLLGSTVIVLFPQDTLSFNPYWQEGGAVRLGEMMGKHTA